MDILFNDTIVSERKSEYSTTVHATKIWKKSTTITLQVSREPKGDYHYEALSKSVEDLLIFTDFNFDAVAFDGDRSSFVSAKIDTIWQEERHKIITPAIKDPRRA